MAKSIIKRELTEFQLEKIKQFTEVELKKFVDNDLPVCYQIGENTIIIGSFKVIRLNDGCWRVFEKKIENFDFFLRKNAIYYCIALHVKNYKLANQLKVIDDLLGNLEFDARLCRYRYNHAKQIQDSWEIDLYSNKYSEIIVKIQNTKKELKKTISLAKYIKPI